MIKNVNKKLFIGIFLLLIPILIWFLLHIFRDDIIALSDNFSPCIFLEKYGILCPGCGNTRAVRAVLEGNFIEAFRYNITIPLVIALFLFYYIVFVLKYIGLTVKQFVKREIVVTLLIIVLIIYYFLRNSI
jgi:hypothetical protein